MNTVGELTGFLESVAPLSLQESYDNSGLLTGSLLDKVEGVLVTLDCTEEVIREAKEIGANVIVCHHPLIFSGLKKLTDSNYVERALVQAIRNKISIYAIHTNLDNVINGVNNEICKRLDLINTGILKPSSGKLRKLVVYCPVNHAGKLRDAIFNAGAGHIGDYDRCSFNSEGYGTFRAGVNARPFVGNQGDIHQESETRIEIIYPVYIENNVLAAMRDSHPYEEVAYDIFAVENKTSQTGSGMFGELSDSIDEDSFLSLLKDKFGTNCIRHTLKLGKPITKVAVCGGSGSFLLQEAIKIGAQVFVSADFKYHQFFDADNNIMIADIGHYESEQFTKDYLFNILRKKFPTFALYLSKVNTNPINYF